MIFYIWTAFFIIILHHIFLISGFAGTTSLTSLNNNNIFGFVNASCFHQPWFCQLLEVFQYKKINQVKLQDTNFTFTLIHLNKMAAFLSR